MKQTLDDIALAVLAYYGREISPSREVVNLFPRVTFYYLANSAGYFHGQIAKYSNNGFKPLHRTTVCCHIVAIRDAVDVYLAKGVIVNPILPAVIDLCKTLNLDLVYEKFDARAFAVNLYKERGGIRRKQLQSVHNTY